MNTSEPIDVVFTWVDGAWPGYQEQLAAHAQRPVDKNPNRYRDNLDLLRFGLRSLCMHMPWFRRVVLVSQRPQLPAWLNLSADRLCIVHHDAFMPSAALPTFSSFAIVANLCRIEGLSRRFLYVEDDFLLMRPCAREDLFWPDGAHRLYTGFGRSDHRGHDDPNLNPWNAALANANRLLDARYGKTRRRALKHAPIVFDCDAWPEFAQAFLDALATTTRARFRTLGTVPVEHLFPWFLHHEQRARPVPLTTAMRDTGYVGLDNFTLLLRLQLWWLRVRRPRWYCLNDNFGPAPSTTSVALVRSFLETLYPTPSPFER